MLGKVKKIFPRGFGWLRRIDDPAAEDVYFHASELPINFQEQRRMPEVGTVFEFCLGTRNSKSCAKDMRVIVEEPGTPESTVAPNVR
jgi:hypothetical protein